MPIMLICGICNAKLAAPERAAGKRVKCRQCGEVLVVPVAEPVLEQAEDAPHDPDSNPHDLAFNDDTRPKKKRVSEVARKRSDEDDEDDAPKYRKEQSGSGTRIPLLIGGGVLGAALIAALVYFLGQSKPEGNNAKVAETPNPNDGHQQKDDDHRKLPSGNAPPVGWKQYDYPEFSAWYFDTNKNPIVTYSQKSGPFGDPVTDEREVWNESKGTPTRMLFIYAVPLTPENQTRAANQPAEVLISILHNKHRCDGLKASDLKPSTLDGQPAFEVVENQPRFTAVWTGAIANNRAYLLAVSGARLTESDTAVTTFRKGFRFSTNAPAVPSAGGDGDTGGPNPKPVDPKPKPVDPNPKPVDPKPKPQPDPASNRADWVATDLTQHGIPIQIRLPKGAVVKADKSDGQLRLVVEPEPGSQILILRQTLEAQKGIDKSREEGFRFINDLKTFYFAECKGVNPPPNQKGFIFASEVVAYEKTYCVPGGQSSLSCGH